MPESKLPESRATEPSPYTLWVQLEAKEGQADELEAILVKAGRSIREEPGNIQFLVHRDLDVSKPSLCL